LSVVEIIIRDERVSWASRDYIALGYAARKGYSPVVELQLGDKRLKSANVEYLLNWAARMLTEHKGRVNPASNDEDNTIQITALSGHLHVLKLLLTDPRVNPGKAIYDEFKHNDS
jgi:hypothetical protein